jgi:hypothetical protein
MEGWKTHLALDGSIIEIETPDYVLLGGVEISGTVKNLGTNTIESLVLSYSIDGEIQGEFTESVIIAPFTTHTYTHLSPWYAENIGEHELMLTVSNINGLGVDSVLFNDVASKTIIVKEPIPNILPSYYSAGNTFTYDVIVNSSDQISEPRDLDFHQAGDLWVINKGTENSGGSTVKITNPWTSSQSDLWQQDDNAWHFMSLPSGIAFGTSDNFATSPSVFDANHQGGNNPFTGPTLWSSNPNIYAQPSGGNGSHMDMLHESPNALGIAFESHNTYWVYDSYNNDVVRYEFSDDHGPGNSYHGDGLIHRYPGMGLDNINTHIVCHLELDENQQWLYFVDNGNNRVLRLDITTGSLGGTPSFGPHEDVAEYKNIIGFDWEEVVTTGLVEPAGIDVIGNNMVVTDHSNGDIIFYDITTMPAVELGRLETGEPGIMGTVLGPQGRVWYCNTTLDKVVRVEPENVIISNSELDFISTTVLYPNPVANTLHVSIDASNSAEEVVIVDVEGREIIRESVRKEFITIDVTSLNSGIFFIIIGEETLSFIVE